MQTVLEQGSIDKPLTFDVGLIQLSFIPVCSLNTCNISVKLCLGFALQCFSLNRDFGTVNCVNLFKKFVRRHNAMSSKYGVRRTHVCEGICIPLVVSHELSKHITISRGHETHYYK